MRPVSEPENSDAIALRAAISILQMQRERSKADLKTLEQWKRHAVAEPESFMREIRANRGQIVDGTMQQLEASKDHISPSHRPLASHNDHAHGNAKGLDMDVDGKEEVSVSKLQQTFSSSPGSIPTPQNIVRCPPINWAKYHIAGEPLDRMHEEQRRRPDYVPLLHQDTRTPEAVLAAPYRPFVDKVGRSVKASEDKRSGTTSS